MSAQGHREAAATHSAEGSDHESRYDPNGEEQGIGHGAASDEYGTISTFEYNPTEQHLQHAQKHRAHATDHEAASRDLEAFEEAECGRFAPAVRKICPLMGNTVALEDIDHGVRVRFSQSVKLDAALAHVRCHLAFARKVGRRGMDHCPLYLKGVEAQSEGASGAVDLVVADEALVSTLRERARAHVATALTP